MFNRIRKMAQNVAGDNKYGVQLFASLLVCYPEVATVTYTPRDTEVVFDFVIDGAVDAERIDKFMRFLDESVQTYHSLETGEHVYLAAEAESYAGTTTIVHLHRQLINMTRGEITLIADLFCDEFGERLRLDSPPPGLLEQEFLDGQSALLDDLLDQIPEHRIMCSMVGSREDNRVVVYNR